MPAPVPKKMKANSPKTLPDHDGGKGAETVRIVPVCLGEIALSFEAKRRLLVY